MTEIQQQLFALQDKQYRQFHSSLIPTLPPEKIIGVRMPAMRRLAKQLAKRSCIEAFMRTLPHEYYDENTLHGLILCEEKDYDKTIALLNRWLPFVDNWATCDLVQPRAFRLAAKQQPDRLLTDCLRWVGSTEPYTIRFGVNMLMTHFLDNLFRPELLARVAAIESDHYYVRMGVAWYFATALAKQYEAALPYIEQHRLADWTHRKTIQKAIESYRISDDHKAYLKTFR